MMTAGKQMNLLGGLSSAQVSSHHVQLSEWGRGKERLGSVPFKLKGLPAYDALIDMMHHLPTGICNSVAIKCMGL